MHSIGTRCVFEIVVVDVLASAFALTAISICLKHKNYKHTHKQSAYINAVHVLIKSCANIRNRGADNLVHTFQRESIDYNFQKAQTIFH